MMFMKPAALLAATATASLAAADSVGVRSAGNHVFEGFESGLEVHDKNGLRVSEGTACTGEQRIPFMMTNVELTAEGDEHYFGFHSGSGTDGFQFLKNVRYCPAHWSWGWNPYRVYGEVVSLDEFKNAVEEEINLNPALNHVLYNIHGVSTDPKGSFAGSYNFDEFFQATGYLVIPISWRSIWNTVGFAAYEISRNSYAPPAGLELAAQFDVFKSSVPTSLMAHSMGNYVTRMLAQNAVNLEVVFENFFMVAADARMDMFGTEFNPAARWDTAAKGYAAAADAYLEIPDSELRENGGYAITQIAGHVHVVWNSGDNALLSRQIFQDGWGSNIRNALGKNGDQSEELTTLPYFKDRVTYHDFSPLVGGAIEHSYQWGEYAVELYVEYKSGDNAAAAPPRSQSSAKNGEMN